MEFVPFASGVLLISLLIFLTLLPLLVWSFCQEAPRPSWQLAIAFILCLFLPTLGVLFVLIYVLNIVITHKARVRNKLKVSNS
ncbi:hypothetical protein CWE13_07900 [Aliidiomarina shirensis]|uniref:Uncharacterized protein n=1 Tax=Aliidiomarina shirensis TaxID=1048642 RepID=A0A432WSN9_9GAMM|nr:hypothetical protein CWE13_07900 [Aliidiomarina shirensis]